MPLFQDGSLMVLCHYCGEELQHPMMHKAPIFHRHNTVQFMAWL